MLRRLGLESLIASRSCRERDLVVAMIAQRILHPSSKLAATRLWETTTLAEELGVGDIPISKTTDPSTLQNEAFRLLQQELWSVTRNSPNAESHLPQEVTLYLGLEIPTKSTNRKPSGGREIVYFLRSFIVQCSEVSPVAQQSGGGPVGMIGTDAVARVGDHQP